MVTFGVLVVGIVGYLGFVAFVRADKAAGSGVLVLGAATGFAAFFSPCSFPLLLTFLARRSEESKGSALLSGLRVGFGAALLLGLLGLVLALGGGAVGRLGEEQIVPGKASHGHILDPRPQHVLIAKL